MKIERTTKEIPAKIEITEVYIAGDVLDFMIFSNVIIMKMSKAKELIKILNVYN